MDTSKKSRLAKWLFSACLVVLAGCAHQPTWEKALVFEDGATLEEKILAAAHLAPTPEQLEWQKLEMTAFIHFGINTFVGREWGDGTESPEKFNPTALDAMQWVQTLKDGGMKMVILMAKHHDGFCLWPTNTTAHSVKASPWRNGQGDLLREVKDACDALGVKFGVYLSPWDRNAASYGNSPEYNAFFREQLTELLTWYGKVDEVWFDGACAEGPNGKKQEYDWASYYQVIRKLQPQAVIAIKGEDIRWVGTESGYGRPTEWSVTALAPGGTPEMEAINKRLGIDETSPDLGSRSMIEKADRLFWYPAEVDVSIRPGWFYHAHEDNKVKSLAHMVDIYFNSVGMNAVLLLNVPPDPRGLIHENDAARLKEFKNWIDLAFAKNLIENAVAVSQKTHATIDGELNTFTTLRRFPASLEFLLDGEKTFDIFEIHGHIQKGQRVEAFSLEAFVDGKWKEIAAGTTIGYKRLLRFAPVTSSRIRLTINQSRHHALISEMGLYLGPEILSDPQITRCKEGQVSIASEAAYPVITFTTDGSEPTPKSEVYSAPFPLPQGGTVKARAFVNDFKTMGSIISESFDICPAKWSIVEASEGHPAFPANMAIDGQSSTMWHTPWDGDVKAHPHSIAVDMGEVLLLKGFTYQPRTDGSFSGTVLSFSFETSMDGKKWEKTLREASFANMINNPSRQKVLFETPVSARFFRFTSHSGIYGEAWVSVGELGVISITKVF